MTETQASSLSKRVMDASAERDALLARVDLLSAAQGSGPVPLLAVATIAVLSAAVTAFTMLRLGRPGPVVTSTEPAPTGLAPTR
jgi:hypothetical protein